MTRFLAYVFICLGLPALAQTTNASDLAVEGNERTRTACLEGEKTSCNNWANNLEHGRGVPMDKAKAREIYAKACDMGEAYSCSNVGLLMQDGRGGPVDPEGALDWLKRGCDGGDPKGCAWIATLHRDIPDLANPVIAADYDARGCEMGYVASCIWYGIALEDGTGVVQDIAGALAAYSQACDGRNPMGCYNAALTLKRTGNDSLGKDRFDRSVALAERGCDMRHTTSCDALAYALSIGRGIARDKPRARALYEDTCARDSKLACRNLALMLRSGQGGPRDFARSNELMQMACALGNAKACE